MNTKITISFECDTTSGTIGVYKQKCIDYDGERVNIGIPEFCAFHPGEFDALKEYAPDFEAIAKAIWTPEVIAAWNQKQATIQE